MLNKIKYIFKSLGVKRTFLVLFMLVLTALFLSFILHEKKESFGTIFEYPQFIENQSTNKTYLTKMLLSTLYNSQEVFSYQNNELIDVFKIKISNVELDSFFTKYQFNQVPTTQSDDRSYFKSDSLSCTAYQFHTRWYINCKDLDLDLQSIFPGVDITKLVNGDTVSFLENNKAVYAEDLLPLIDLNRGYYSFGDWNFIELQSSKYKAASLVASLSAVNREPNRLMVKVLDTDLNVCSGEGCDNLMFIDFLYPKTLEIQHVSIVYFRVKNPNIDKDNIYFLVPFYKLEVKGEVIPDYPSHWPDELIKTLPKQANVHYQFFIPAIQPGYLGNISR